MCGIVGAISGRNVSQILVNGLKDLEYRGYDSAGVAIYDRESGIKLVRTVGKVKNLEKGLEQSPVKGMIGIAHTRWATHGEPAEHNAHPQVSKSLAVVHNGIIENHAELRDKLVAEGFSFASDTDTEVIAHLIESYFAKEKDILKAVQLSVKNLTGAYSIAVICEHDTSAIYVAKSGSPLVVGLGIDENFIASDELALDASVTKIVYLQDGEVAKISVNEVNVYSKSGNIIEPNVVEIAREQTSTDKGAFKHYMLKEIFEQPTAIQSALEGRFIDNNIIIESFGYEAKIFSQVESVFIVACGTSYHAGLVAKYWIESIVGIPCFVEIASEFKYRKVAIIKNSLFITISQSGETADTIAALSKAKDMQFLKTLSICNVANSTLARDSDMCVLTKAGREIGVASTKAFTSQLITLLLLALGMAKEKGNHYREIKSRTLNDLLNAIDLILTNHDHIKDLATLFLDKHSTLFLGRGSLYPIAEEGALKLKEISYIHAESYPAGELKHGPLALIDKNMPVVVVAPNDQMIKKIHSNLNEVSARRGELFVFTDSKDIIANDKKTHIFSMPTIQEILNPILYTVPLQLLAYYVAVGKGTDVDQPRNLAKSVTVE